MGRCCVQDRCSADERPSRLRQRRDRGPRPPPVYSPRSPPPCQISFGNSRAALWRSEADPRRERRRYSTLAEEVLPLPSLAKLTCPPHPTSKLVSRVRRWEGASSAGQGPPIVPLGSCRRYLDGERCWIYRGPPWLYPYSSVLELPSRSSPIASLDPRPARPNRPPTFTVRQRSANAGGR
ncbi:hypothetical protein BD413DRAFT_47665 [Trametes elegans]|nr:hypothetical protein BD413DRAFT_47665 [Trametes elegans]